MTTPDTNTTIPDEQGGSRNAPYTFRVSPAEQAYLRGLLREAGWGEDPELGPGVRQILHALQEQGLTADWVIGDRLCPVGPPSVTLPIRIPPALRAYINQRRGCVASTSWVREVLCRLPRERALGILRRPDPA